MFSSGIKILIIVFLFFRCGSVHLSVCLWSKSCKFGYLFGLFDGIFGSSCVSENSNVVGFVEIFESGGELIRIAL
jgi:hypothetical protein